MPSPKSLAFAVAFVLAVLNVLPVRAADEARAQGLVQVPAQGTAQSAAPVARPWKVAWKQGRAWLEAPDGELWWSKGVVTVNGGHAGPKARAGQAYAWEEFYPSLAAWGQDTEARLKAWGFNTAGGWSDASAAMSLPTIPEIDLGRNSRLHWFDIFDPQMPGATYLMARELTAPYAGNARVMGYFTDNEVGWWNSPLFLWHLKKPWSNNSKRELYDLLRAEYGGRYSRLLEDFVPGPGVTDFDSLKNEGASLKLRPGGRGIAVVGKWTARIAGRYYALTHKALRHAAPGALIVGDRLPLYYNQDAVLASRGLLDILSTNYNVDEIDGWVAPYYFEGLAKLTGQPVLVSEFFFAADENRSGNTNNGHLMHVKTQAQRVAGAAFAQSMFASFPNVLGAHWFQYADEPTGGRGDGEDYNMGLVDVRNRPYEDLAAALARVNAKAEDIHRQKPFWQDGLPGSAEPGADVLVPRLPKQPDLADNGLPDWPDKAGTRVRGWRVDKPYQPFGDAHLAWTPESLCLGNYASNYIDLNLLAYEGEFPLSETYAIHLEVKDTDRGASWHYAIHLVPGRHHEFGERVEAVPQLWRYENGKPVERLDHTGLVASSDKPLPHITVEAALPARLFGRTGFAAGDRLDMRIWIDSFYRERSMSFDAGSFFTRMTPGTRRAVLTDSANTPRGEHP